MPSLKSISRDLSKAVDKLHFGEPVTHVYNPLNYARASHENYLEQWGRGSKRAVFFGMNPGPWGMAQTGVPFGEIELVRDWMGIEGSVSKPRNEHPKRPVLGFDCERSEVSGRRLWGWVRDVWGSPEAFFSEYFVSNYCPLVFMEDSGRNRTPDKLPAAETQPLYEACDRAMARTLELLAPKTVIGVGVFAESCAKRVITAHGLPIEVSRVLHPSPASPIANRGWAPAASKQLAEFLP